MQMVRVFEAKQAAMASVDNASVQADVDNASVQDDVEVAGGAGAAGVEAGEPAVELGAGAAGVEAGIAAVEPGAGGAAVEPGAGAAGFDADWTGVDAGTDAAYIKLGMIERRLMMSEMQVHESVRQIKLAVDVFKHSVSDLNWFSL